MGGHHAAIRVFPEAILRLENRVSSWLILGLGALMDVIDHLRAWPWPFPADELVVVAVSGGVDSMVLAEAMHRLGNSRLVVAHVHHGLRGVEADGDEALVREWSARQRCACEVMRADVAGRAAADGISLETAGRLVRREFFREVAARHDTRRVLLAHHADDQVETLLMNLVRGAGTHGLAGMRPVTCWQGLELIRPLLAIWRCDIEAWARENQIRWREDATNRSLEHFRNRVRHDVLPALEAASGRGVKELLRRTAVLAAEDDAELDRAADAHRETLAAAASGWLLVAPLLRLPPALARRLVREWLVVAGVADVGFEVVDAVLVVARSTARPASCNLAGGRRVRRRAGALFMDSQRPAALPPQR